MRTFFFGVLIGIALVPVASLVLHAGFLPIAATSQPPFWEKSLARRAMRASVQRVAPPQPNPVAVSEENLLAGMNTFKNDCAGCHGNADQPSRWGTTSFYPRVPQFAQEAPHLTAPEMFWVVKHGVRYTGMAAGDGVLTDNQIWRAVTFLSSLEHLPPRVAEEFHRKQ
jgi:mono/diheme cytochrome c family protein